MNSKLLAIILIIVALILLVRFYSPGNQSANGKMRFLCDASVPCATPQATQVPKGVCRPGNECT